MRVGVKARAKIAETAGRAAQIVHQPLPADDPKQRRPDITLAKKFLKWEPTVPLAEGLKRTIAYFKAKV